MAFVKSSSNRKRRLAASSMPPSTGVSKRKESSRRFSRLKSSFKHVKVCKGPQRGTKPRVVDLLLPLKSS